jgi:hypothetical protein
VQVDAVKQRARELAAVTLSFAIVARAGALRIAGEAAGAGVHRRDEKKVAGEDRCATDPDEAHSPFLERLADGFEHVAAELRKLI